MVIIHKLSRTLLVILSRQILKHHIHYAFAFCGFDDCKGIANVLSSGITPKHNSLLLFSLEFAKLTFTYVVGVVDFRMG